MFGRAWQDFGQGFVMLTKEDIILLYLENPSKLWTVIELNEDLKQFEPSDEMRELICSFGHANLGYAYARHIDKGPHPVTKKLACTNSTAAYWYAEDIIRGPDPELEETICKSPEDVYFYVRDVVQQSTEKLKEAALKDEYFGKRYLHHFHPDEFNEKYPDECLRFDLEFVKKS